MTEEDHDGPRVLVLATTFPSRPGDGTPEFVLTLADAMADEADVQILAPRVPGSQRQERWGRITVRRFAYFPRRWETLANDAIMPTIRARPWTLIQAPFLVLAMFLEAWRQSRNGIDAIHAHWLLPAGLVAAIVSRFRGVPFVLTIHGADAHTLTGGVMTRVKRWVLRQAAAVFPVSVDIAEALQLPRQTALPIGVNFDEVAAAVGMRDERPEGFLFLGRLAEKKGVDVLLKAVAEVPDAQLRIGGDGPDRAGLELLASDLGLNDRVTFLGRLERPEVMRELRTAGAVVVPSRVAADGDQDGTPVVMMEAVAAGVPVIVSSLGGLSEYIRQGETGLVSPPGDVDALAANLSRALAEPEELERLATRAQQRLRQEFDISVVAARYQDALHRALASTIGPSR